MNLQMMGERYLKVTKTYGSIVGTWPYQSQHRKWIQRAIILTVATFTITTMVSNIVVFFSMQTITDQIPTLMAATGMCVKHINFALNDKKFKDMINSMLNDWRDEKTREEEMIMEMYADRGVFFSFIYAINAYFCTGVFFFLPVVPRLMDVLIPLNESRPWIQIYAAYYFTDNEDDYYFVIILYSILGLLLAMCGFIAADSTLICIVQHACGLFALSGLRFKNSMDQLQTVKSDSSADLETYRRVCQAINSHKRALAYLNEIEKLYAQNLVLQVGMVVLSFTVTLLKVTTERLSMETYPYYGFAVGQVVHIFFLTIQGQFVIDSQDRVYANGYEAQWYNGRCKTQALFILILRQNLTPPMLTAGGLIQLNLDTFAGIVKTCVSYFTVLKSV